MPKHVHHGRITKKRATLYAAGVFFTILSLTSIKNAYGADAPEGAPTLSAYGADAPEGAEPCGADSPTQYPCDAPPPKPLVTVPIPTCPAGQRWSSAPPVGCYANDTGAPVFTIPPTSTPPQPADDNSTKPCPAYGVRAEDGSCVDPHFWDSVPATTVPARPAVKAPAKKVSHAVVKHHSLPAHPVTELVMSGESQIAFVLNFLGES